MTLSNLSGGELSSVASLLQQPAENFGNDPSLEMLWAVKAYEHAETYFNILLSVDTQLLRLSPIDDELYNRFRAEFQCMPVDVLIESDLKSSEQKTKWRKFCYEFENRVDDWNTGTLLRLRADQDFSESNTTLVPRIQFLAIEVARNREGFNRCLRKLYGSKITDCTKQSIASEH